MGKHERQFVIREILGRTAVGSQDDLRRHLARRGYRVTQATLSRDMHELGIVRMTDNGGPRYAIPPAGEARIPRPLVGAEVRGIVANESVIVIHTLAGAAHTVGEYIDVHDHPDILGTVAGDNTLLVLPRSQKLTSQVLAFLKHTLIEGR
jgi:transcriptional regulator of arginine metabolism